MCVPILCRLNEIGCLVQFGKPAVTGPRLGLTWCAEKVPQNVWYVSALIKGMHSDVCELYLVVVSGNNKGQVQL